MKLEVRKMERRIISDIYLDAEQSRKFVGNYIMPDREAIDKRDCFISNLSEVNTIDGESFEVDVPDLDLSFLDGNSSIIISQGIHEKNVITFDTTEHSIDVQHHSVGNVQFDEFEKNQNVGYSIFKTKNKIWNTFCEKIA